MDLDHSNNMGEQYAFPLYLSRVSAGFPSPADEYMECKLDLNKHLIKNPAATFFMKSVCDSLKESGIFSGDLLIVDRSMNPSNGKIVIAVIEGELLIKQYHKRKDYVILSSDNQLNENIIVNSESDLDIWGVVTSVIKSL